MLQPGQRNEPYHESLVRGLSVSAVEVMIVWIGLDKGRGLESLGVKGR